MSEEQQEEQQEEEPVGEPEEAGCWLDHARICGYDCVAYDDRHQGNPVFNACLILNVGRSLVVSLAGIEKAYSGLRKQAANDELRRRVDIPPPKVNP